MVHIIHSNNNIFSFIHYAWFVHYEYFPNIKYLDFSKLDYINWKKNYWFLTWGTLFYTMYFFCSMFVSSKTSKSYLAAFSYILIHLRVHRISFWNTIKCVYTYWSLGPRSSYALIASKSTRKQTNINSITLYTLDTYA